MTQEKIYQYLKTHQWTTIKKIAEDINISQTSVQRNLRKLRQFGFVTNRITKTNLKNKNQFEYSITQTPIYRIKNTNPTKQQNQNED